MKKNVIAAQLYTLRDFLKTPADIVSTIKKVKAMGFEAVQASGFSYDPKEFKKLLDDEGLVCCATHEGGKDILETPEKIAEKLDILGCDYTAYPWPHTNPASAADYVALAKQLDKAGEVLAQGRQGPLLPQPLRRVREVRQEARPRNHLRGDEPRSSSKAKIDTTGSSTAPEPVDWIKKLKKRLPLLHLKDYGIINREVKIFEIGGGNLGLGSPSSRPERPPEPSGSS
jgi:sugar phosphate isomerase/epimerase